MTPNERIRRENIEVVLKVVLVCLIVLRLVPVVFHMPTIWLAFTDKTKLPKLGVFYKVSDLQARLLQIPDDIANGTNTRTISSLEMSELASQITDLGSNLPRQAVHFKPKLDDAAQAASACRTELKTVNKAVAVLPSLSNVHAKLQDAKEEIIKEMVYSVGNLHAVRIVFDTIALCSLLFLIYAYRKNVLNAENALTQKQERLVQVRKILDEIANHDSLTGMLNRSGFERILTREVALASRQSLPLIGVLLDCDDFKVVNERFGHGGGDQALKRIAMELSDTMRTGDQVARIGDEFVMLLPHTNVAEAMTVCERIKTAISSKKIKLGDSATTVTASIGVVSLPTSTSSIEDLLALARPALKRSKALGKNTVSSAADIRYADTDSQLEADAANLANQLRSGAGINAVTEGIHNISDNGILGYEMLSRGPEGPFKAPDRFLKLAVAEKILTTVDMNCLRKCAEKAMSLPYGCRVHFNLYPSTIVDIPLENISSILQKHLHHYSVCIELSEQEFIGSPEYLQPYVKDMKRLGMLIAIDDVGFGKSSLEALILLEPDIVKIDTRFIAGIAKDASRRHMLKRLIRVIESIGAAAVAEGVEDKADAQAVFEMGVKYGQGRLWQTPAVAVETTT